MAAKRKKSGGRGATDSKQVGAASPKNSSGAAGDSGDGRRRGGILFLVLTPVILGLTAFASVYLMPDRLVSGGSGLASAKCTSPASLRAAIDLAGPALDEITFVKLEPLVISLGSGDAARHLKISLTLETSETSQGVVERATPKLRDAFTGYLRAVRFSQLDDPSSMARIRAQLLRRAKVVLGERRVDGVLITDFVLT